MFEADSDETDFSAEEKDINVPLLSPSSLSHNASKQCSKKLAEEGVECEEIADESGISPALIKNVPSEKDLIDEDVEKPQLEVKPSCEKVPFELGHDKHGSITQVPAVLNQYLRDYQRDGVKFMFDHLKREEGCILGDDMGLGKTVQVIALISALLGKTGTLEDVQPSYFKKNKVAEQGKKFIGSTLIVSPSSVMFNWEDELETWGYFKVAKFHRAAKTEVIEKAKKGKLDVVLTTFETFRNHISILDEVNWFCMIFDEAHKIKEPNSQVTKAAKAVSCRRRIGLTGTPMQNNMEELWCLLDWANPNCLRQLENFNNKFAIPIKIGQRFNATKSELALARKRQQEFGLLRDKWILRRTKDLLVGQLPRKDERAAFAPLSELQIALYKKILEFPQPTYVNRSEDPCECGSGVARSKCCFKLNDEERRKLKKAIFQFMTLLRKVSNHAALLLPFHKASEAQKGLALSVCQQLFPAFPLLREAYEDGSFTKMSDTRFCGKMKVLDQLLKDMERAKDKVLLFSTSVQLLNILEAYAISRGYIYRRLDGETKPENRISIVREFNKNDDVFLCLISTTAGGLGLNLTGANRVIIFDPSWNPSWDGQAQDRAYRVGQHRNVRVYRLISSGSIEENMYLRQIYKQQLSNIAVHTVNERRLFNAVAGCKTMQGELFGIKNMFSIREKGSTLTDKIIKRTEEIEALVMEKNEQQESSVGMVEHKYKKTVDKNKVSDDDYDDESPSQIIEELESDIDKYIDDHCMGSDSEDDKIDCPPLVWEQENSFGNYAEDEDDFPENADKERNLFEKETDSSSGEEQFLPGQANKIPKRENNCPKKQTSEASQMVDEVLERCGVGYTSTVKNVLKRSEAEDKMTSKAIKDVYWHGLNSRKPANFLESQSSEESDDIPCTATAKQDYTKRKQQPKNEFTRKRVFERIGNDMFLVGETPPAIRKQQFEEIAKDAGFSSSLELAKEIVQWPKDRVIDTLVGFYKKTEPDIERVSSFGSIYTDNAVAKAYADSVTSKIEGASRRNFARNENRKPFRTRKSLTKKVGNLNRSGFNSIRPTKDLKNRGKLKRTLKKRTRCAKPVFTKLKDSGNKKNGLYNDRTEAAAINDDYNWDIWSESDKDDGSPVCPELSFSDDNLGCDNEVSMCSEEETPCREDKNSIHFYIKDEDDIDRPETKNASTTKVMISKDGVLSRTAETSQIMSESSTFVDYMLTDSVENTEGAAGMDKLLEVKGPFDMEVSEQRRNVVTKSPGSESAIEASIWRSESLSVLDELLNDDTCVKGDKGKEDALELTGLNGRIEYNCDSQMDTSIIDDLMG